MKKFINNTILFLSFIVIALIFIIIFVPVKYLPLDVNPDAIHAVTVPRAQAVEYYDVYGKNESEILQELKTKGVDRIGGDAVTSYNIGYKFYKFNPDTPECFIRDVEVTYNVKVVIPRWVNLKEASLADVWWWESTVKYFAYHEGVHVQILLDNVGSVKTAIEAGNCETAAAEGDKAIKAIQQMQKDYDREVTREMQGGI
jgi:predicted secreted Zn-dependent protease